MYNNFFGFTADPFNTEPQPGFYYGTQTHDNALNLLEYGVTSRKGFILLTAEQGAGKSVTALRLLEKLSASKSAYISSKRHSGKILSEICRQFDLDEYIDSPEDICLGRIIELLVNEYKDGNNAFIILDDASRLTREDYIKILQLNDVEIESCKLVQFIFIDRPVFEKQEGEEDIAQDIFPFEINILPLSASEVSEYISRRLEAVMDKPEEVFKKSAIHQIYESSGGIPLKINQLADIAMLKAHNAKSKKVTTKHVSQAETELFGKPVKKGTSSMLALGVAVLAVSVVAGVYFYSKSNVQTALNDTDPVAKQESPSQPEPKVATETLPEPVDALEPMIEDTQEQEVQPETEVPQIDVDETQEQDTADSQPEPETAAEPEAQPIQYGCITAESGLKMRDRPTTGSEVVAVAPQGTKVEILETVNVSNMEWYRVNFVDQNGYMYAPFVNILEDGSQSCN